MITLTKPSTGPLKVHEIYIELLNVPVLLLYRLHIQVERVLCEYHSGLVSLVAQIKGLVPVTRPLFGEVVFSEYFAVLLNVHNG